MGQGSEDLSAVVDALEGCGINPDVFYGIRSASRARKRPYFNATPLNVVVHNPDSDAAAKALILSLDHFEWDTHKVSGRFDRNPFHLTATINGLSHRINLLGRFGGVLKWLDEQERARANSRELEGVER